MLCGLLALEAIPRAKSRILYFNPTFRMKKTLAILAATCLLIDLTRAQTTVTTGTGESSSIVGYQIDEQGAESREIGGSNPPARARRYKQTLRRLFYDYFGPFLPVRKCYLA